MNKTRLDRILVAMPSGMGAGLFGVRDLRTLAPSARQMSDADALRGDWNRIGQYFRAAVQKLQAEQALITPHTNLPARP